MKQIKKVTILVISLLAVFLAASCFAAEGKASNELMILFTHDLHSYFQPHSNLTSSGKTEQVGGYAKLAYLINEQRILHKNKTLRIDAGDFSMGTLFHTSFADEASELRLMGKIGYDVVTLGNHDFDFHPAGLAKALQAAQAKSKQLPAIVASNVIFSKDDPRDSTLKQAFKDYPVAEYTVITRNGIRIGLFGIVGKDARDDTPFAKPVTFSDPVVAGQRMVDILKNKEKVDMIICLSHTGTSPVKSKSEDEVLARKVPQIDVIISGHTHTVLPQPIVIGKTIIASAGSYGEYLGMLGINFSREKGVQLSSYEIKRISTATPDNTIIAAEVQKYKALVNKNFLAPYNLSFDQVVSQSDFDMESLNSAYQNPREMGLGNMITDAYRFAVKKAEGKNYEYVSMAIEPLGLIRGSFQKGKITVEDVFQVLSLGLGMDGVAGYPLVAFYISGKELKDVLEVHTTVAPLMKVGAHLQVSGVKFSYNPHRMFFDRVTEVLIQDKNGEFLPLDQRKLYRVCANLYTAEMVDYVSRVTHGLLNVQPKDKNGQALPDYKKAVIYVDKKSSQPPELKEWLALAEYMSSFKSEKGIPRIPEKYMKAEGRYLSEPSWNPVGLIAGGNTITYGALFLGILFLFVLGLIILYIVKKIRLTNNTR
ncbi:MAG: bifunctional metallophosphatase/5'-nucleotidase [Deltaproteobacteria bacterium HGW-Deltaproteobacteria-10]|nr:MAG: bifunctional metallophosphatase/5'-nucleotidase [Deltaproteobacteria bacterium HGW-Deltaproteobacteria-10]